MSELTVNELNDKIINFQKFRTAYELEILTKDEFKELAGKLFESTTT